MTDTTETVRKEISDLFKDFRIVSFNGNVDDWPKWSKKFMAVAKLKKFASIIDGPKTVPAYEENMNGKDSAIRDLSQAAYCCLLYSMEEEISLTSWIQLNQRIYQMEMQL